MKPYPVKRLSVVIPVYNEEDSLPELLQRTRAACEQLSCPFEIILVDDGSRDRSAELLQEAAAEPGSPVVAVILNRNYGQHAAIMAGFEQCTGDLVITMDADLQNPPEEIPRLVKVAAEGYDVVGTVRQRRQDSTLRRVPSRLINLAAIHSTGDCHERLRLHAARLPTQCRRCNAEMPGAQHVHPAAGQQLCPIHLRSPGAPCGARTW